MKKDKQHDRNLDEVLRHLSVQYPCIIAKEAQFFDETGRLICAPDGWIYDGRHRVLEYKCGEGHRAYALVQLGRAAAHIYEMFDVEHVGKLYACKNKKPEIIS